MLEATCLSPCEKQEPTPLVPVKPVVSAVSPTSVPVGSVTRTVQITGTSFVPDTVLTVDGVDVETIYVNSTTLRAIIAPSAQSAPKTVQVGARTGSLISTATIPFQFTAATYSITSLAPSTSPVSFEKQTISVTGTGFIPSTQVLWNGTSMETIYVSTTQVRFNVPSMPTAGVFPVTVKNGASTGTGSVNFTVT